jgi:hypothetical protein
MQACLATTIVEIASVMCAYSNQGEEAFENRGSCFIPFPFFFVSVASLLDRF